MNYSTHWRVGFLFLVLYPRLFLLPSSSRPPPVLLPSSSRPPPVLLPSSSRPPPVLLPVLTHSLTHSLTQSLTHSLTCACTYTHTHKLTHLTSPSLLYFLFPSCFSMLSLSLEKLVTCGVIRSYNYNLSGYDDLPHVFSHFNAQPGGVVGQQGRGKGASILLRLGDDWAR